MVEADVAERMVEMKVVAGRAAMAAARAATAVVGTVLVGWEGGAYRAAMVGRAVRIGRRWLGWW